MSGAGVQNKYAAQRALLRNGEQLSPSLMVGVKPLDPVHRAAIQENLQVGSMLAAAFAANVVLCADRYRLIEMLAAPAGGLLGWQPPLFLGSLA